MKPFLICFLVSIVFILPGSLTATTYYVDPGERIQDAINASTNGDTIIVRTGTYTGVGNRDLDFSNGLPPGQTRAITLKSESGAEVTIIDCEGSELDQHRGFYFHSGEGTDSVVDGFTITGGLVKDEPLNKGAAIICENSSPTIKDCTISSNRAESGGGIWLTNSSPSITGCTLRENIATSTGGGLGAEDSYPTITSCLIESNKTIDGEGGGLYQMRGNITLSQSIISSNESPLCGGGAFLRYLDDTGIIDGCIISDNEGDASGGMYIGNSHAIITNTSVTGNSSGSGPAGGIECWVSDIEISDSTFSDNSGGPGGALAAIEGGLLQIDRCVIERNTSHHTGGIIAVDVATVRLNNCVFRYNSSTDNDGGGLWVSGGDLTVRDCTFKWNEAYAYGGGADIGGCNSIVENCTFSHNKAREGGGLSTAYGNHRISNCLFTDNNIYGFKGGGISLWYGTNVLENCTIANNTCAWFSGGIDISFEGSIVTLTNCIVWGNSHHQILVDDESTLTVSYSDVMDGWPGVGNIDADPLFAQGRGHDYYLSHVAAGQVEDSPCVETGSDTAVNLGMDDLTTRNDSEYDIGIVDMGYHTPPTIWISSITRSGNDITIKWKARAGLSFVVEWSTDIDFATYTEVPVGTTYTWTDIGGASGMQKYYRVREQ